MTSSTFTIRIPPKPQTEQAKQKTPSVSRKNAKRRITSEDEDEDEPSPTPLKGSSKKPRVEDSHPSKQPVTPKAIGSSTASSTKKRKARILSDEDNDYVPDPEEKSALSKPKMKGKGKATGSVKTTARDESRLLNPPSGSTAKKRPRVEEEPDVTNTTKPVATASSSVPASEEPVPIRKLPPIKKKTKQNSASTSVAASPTPSSAVAPKTASKAGNGPPKVPAPSTAALPKKPQGPVQATTTNPSGSGDFDLRDSNTWQSILGKGSSSSGPRVGVEKRVSTEERRKQLEKMRDEARLAREQQSKEPFDLQAHSRKIAAFEKKLQVEHLVKINSPHVLGAAFLARPIPGIRSR